MSFSGDEVAAVSLIEKCMGIKPCADKREEGFLSSHCSLFYVDSSFSFFLIVLSSSLSPICFCNKL